jgi:hypothetical protein
VVVGTIHFGSDVISLAITSSGDKVVRVAMTILFMCTTY